MTDLKPCPFCGRKAEIIAMGIAPMYRYLPKCTECICGIGHYDSYEDAKKAWNRRVEE